MRGFAPTVHRSGRTEVLAYVTTGGAGNCPTEAVNRTIKQIKRVGLGFTHSHNYWLRLPLRCGGGVNSQDQIATRLDSGSERHPKPSPLHGVAPYYLVTP